MKNKILVVYASKNGSTAEVAERIGQELTKAGLQNDVLPANRVNCLDEYKAVVFGSAVYIGLWRKEAVSFLKDNEKQLAELPVWIFSSGPTGSGDIMTLMDGWRYPKTQEQVIGHIKPVDITCFHGKLDSKNLNFFEMWIIKNVKAPLGDYRDWEAIASWCKVIAQSNF